MARRYHLLDFIRGVAAILVMQRHVAMRLDKHINEAEGISRRTWYRRKKEAK
jgi:peptidoglycan/LPS O-acetylase OafA/YrhL